MRAKIFAIIAPILGLVFLGIGISGMLTDRRLQAEGSTMPGKLLSHQEQRGSRGRRTYKLEVAYEVPTGVRPSGADYSSKFRVDKSYYDAAVRGGPIIVRYLPSSPGVARLEGAQSESGIISLIGGG